MFGLVALTLLAPSVAVRFAVVGDFGNNSTPELNVSQLIKSWNPDFIASAGDNNYETGSASTIDANIGKYYHDYIYNYTGGYGAGSATVRFVPCAGNHDWGNANNNPTGLNPYLAYFSLPGNERYYSFRKGPVELFVLDSDTNEPSGVTASSVQATWCQSAMASSDALYKIVVFHHAAYSSSQHGSTTYMRWPFAAWGACAVIQGHDHTYERLRVGTTPYFVNGLGGKSIYNWGTILGESQFRYNSDYGAMKVFATYKEITFQFWTRSGQLIDSYVVPAKPLKVNRA